MLRFLRKLLGHTKKKPQLLHFKTTRDAFQYACEYMRQGLVQGAELIGYVEGPSEPDPENRFMTKRLAAGKLRVSLGSKDGVFVARYCGSIASDFSGREPTTGDLVSVTAASYDPVSDEPRNYFLIEVILLPRLLLSGHFQELLKPGLVDSRRDS
jgi:hypothetical protein